MPASEETPAVPNAIKGFMHCKQCLDEWLAGEAGEGVSPREYARLEMGWTPKGFQLWCVRHELNVVSIDLLGQKVDAK